MTVSVTGFTVEGQKMAGKLSKSAVLDAPGIPTLQATLNRNAEKDAVMARPFWALEAPGAPEAVLVLCCAVPSSAVFALKGTMEACFCYW